MRKKIFVCALALLPVFGFTQSGDFSENKEVSYALGILIAKSMLESGLSVDFDAFARGISESLAGKESLNQDKAIELVQKAMELASKQKREENMAKSTSFLAENAKKKGVQTTKSGLQYEVITKGKGAAPHKDSTVVVHYTGMLSDGTVFDSSREREEPATIPLEQVIPGWSEGIQLMRVGGRAKFFIPPALAYGEESGVEEIPPNSVLIFDVELLEIEGE
ncbi:MAG: FKBP-type peptidyl-prolyl cis-trans isomerase [Spirochaetaceae bacterium]|nr:FKBP-type peptidyl-prolyl cis-trans isomerase [Spirochaetaceae bacterium]GMO23702.1 MAG: FKBP-type peptidyl-prolyl cis-trans isomerase [Termitinemataceae bacterium]